MNKKQLEKETRRNDRIERRHQRKIEKAKVNGKKKEAKMEKRRVEREKELAVLVYTFPNDNEIFSKL